jgi:hypothetical protein
MVSLRRADDKKETNEKGRKEGNEPGGKKKKKKKEGHVLKEVGFAFDYRINSLRLTVIASQIKDDEVVRKCVRRAPYELLLNDFRVGLIVFRTHTVVFPFFIFVVLVFVVILHRFVRDKTATNTLVDKE